MSDGLCQLRVLLAALCFILLAATAPAFAHSVLLSSEPKDGAVLAQAPERLLLTFNEAVTPLSVRLIFPGGEQHDLLANTSGDSQLAIDLPGDLKHGAYLLSWRAVSADGHPISGVNGFSIGVVPDGTARHYVEARLEVQLLLWAARVGLYTAMFFGLGSAAYAIFVAPLPPAWRKLALPTIVLGLIAAPLSLALHNADALGLGLAGIWHKSIWQDWNKTSYGWTAVVDMVALMLAAASLFTKWNRAPAVAALLLAPMAFVLSGHAGAANPQWLTRPALYLHIACLLFWIGALLPIYRMPDGRKSQQSLARFSALIPVPIVLIIISGFALAAVQLGPRASYWPSPYGVILACKLMLVVGILLLAARNRFILTGPALRGDGKAMRSLRHSVALEAMLAILILALVAGWRFTPPPRALAAAEPVTIALHMNGANARVDLSVLPGRVGTNRFSIAVAGADGVAIVPLAVGLALSVPSKGIEPLRRDAELQPDGFWRVDGVTIPLAADWEIAVEIRLSRFELVRLTGTLGFP